MIRRLYSLRAIIPFALIFILAAVVALANGGPSVGATGDIAVTGTVTNQSGSGVQNVSVYATEPGGSTVEFGPSTTASDGTYELDVEAGTYDFHFDPASGAGFNSIVESNVTVLNNQTIDVVLLPITHTISGTLTDSAGNPLSNAVLRFTGSGPTGATFQTTTDSNGNYSVTVNANQYNVDVRSYSGDSIGGVGLTNNSGSYYVDASSGNVTQNLQINTATLTVTVNNSDGTPVTNNHVNINGTGGSTTLIPGEPAEWVPQNTSNDGSDPSGTVTLGVIDGLTYSVCGTNEDNGAFACTNVTITGSNTTVVIQEASPTPPIPSAPSNLTIPTPTQNPSLSWTASSGATSYNIYRKGSVVGNTTSTTYTDSSSPEGLVSYYVTAVNGGGESSQSNTVAVVVDRTAPTITYTVSPAPNSAGWNNSPVTVTFNCTDNSGGSGIASCSSPMTESTDGTYNLTGYAVDNAGNSSSINVTVNLDQTTPTVGTPSVSPNPDIAGQSTTITAPASDNLSGVIGGEYFVGSHDPGQGNGVPMTFNSSTGNLSASHIFPFVGTFTINVRSEDAAGNWSSVSSTQLTVNSAAPAAPTNLTVPSPTQNPVLSWTASSGATSYNIYRNGSKVATSSSTAYTDNTAPEGTDSYYVTAVNGGGESGQSNSVSVLVDRTAPAITYTVSPTPNSAGWNNSPVTVTFNCTDNTGGSGIASCSTPMAESNDGTYTLTGTATDNAGNTASVNVTVNVDQTAPTVGNASWSTNPVQVGNSATLTVPATDATSGVVSGEYYIGTDPGVGNGTAMTYSSGNLTATFGSTLGVGVYNIGYRSKDAAGNWSATNTTMLVITDVNTTHSMTGKNKKDLVPSLADGDVMPGLISNTQTDAADYGMTVQYKNGSLDPHNSFDFNYSTGTNCGKNNATNCHTFTLSATSFSWLIVNGTNNSNGEFQGTASVTVDGATTTNPFTVSGTDGNDLTPTTNDYLILKVYATGANPSTATPIYQASGTMSGNTSVVIK